jgi:hypothetical protein
MLILFAARIIIPTVWLLYSLILEILCLISFLRCNHVFQTSYIQLREILLLHSLSVKFSFSSGRCTSVCAAGFPFNKCDNEKCSPLQLGSCRSNAMCINSLNKTSSNRISVRPPAPAPPLAVADLANVAPWFTDRAPGSRMTGLIFLTLF